MDDAVLAALGGEIADAVLHDIALQLLHLRLVLRVRIGPCQAGGGIGVVLGGEGALGMAHRQPAVAQVLERHRARHLMDEMQPDEDLVLRAGQPTHHVPVENLVEQRPAHAVVLAQSGPGRPSLVLPHRAVAWIPYWSPYWYPKVGTAVRRRDGARRTWRAIEPCGGFAPCPRCRTFIIGSGR